MTDIKLPDTSEWGIPDWGIKVLPHDGKGINLRECLVGLAGEVPDQAPWNHGLAQRGSIVDPNTPTFGFTVNRKIEVWADNIADLVEQAKQDQWNATTDIPWDELPPLPEDVERALCQVMTFLIQNEYLALYLPAKFLSRIDPCFSEVVMFLASQVMDEARHVEVFTKRVLANGGGLQYVSSATEWSLRGLLMEEDYTDASFLLHVLGEWTLMELLKFIEKVAPDPVTKKIFKMAWQDEGRHVGYGLSHLGYHIEKDPAIVAQLVRAAEKRTAYLQQASGMSPFVQSALTVLAGGGSAPDQIERGRAHVRQLYDTMPKSRVRTLAQVGFDKRTGERISALHGSAARDSIC